MAASMAKHRIPSIPLVDLTSEYTDNPLLTHYKRIPKYLDGAQLHRFTAVQDYSAQYYKVLDFLIGEISR